MKKILLRFLVLICFSVTANADDKSVYRADSHAPITVMADHMHDAGEFMVSYRVMGMDMNEARSGQTILTESTLFNSYMMIPVSMKMTMHMMGAMYGVSDDITLMAMLPYLNKEMEMKHKMTGAMYTKSSGLGDAKISAMYRIYEQMH